MFPLPRVHLRQRRAVLFRFRVAAAMLLQAALLRSVRLRPSTLAMWKCQQVPQMAEFPAPSALLLGMPDRVRLATPGWLLVWAPLEQEVARRWLVDA